MTNHSPETDSPLFTSSLPMATASFSCSIFILHNMIFHFWENISFWTVRFNIFHCDIIYLTEKKKINHVGNTRYPPALTALDLFRFVQVFNSTLKVQHSNQVQAWTRTVQNLDSGLLHPPDVDLLLLLDQFLSHNPEMELWGDKFAGTTVDHWLICRHDCLNHLSIYRMYGN